MPDFILFTGLWTKQLPDSAFAHFRFARAYRESGLLFPEHRLCRLSNGTVISKKITTFVCSL
jgi:hypothetical protein